MNWYRTVSSRRREEDENGIEIKPLAPSVLRRQCDTSNWTFESSDQVPSAPIMLGQTRAVEALNFGANMARPGYNLYVLSPQGAGNRPAIISHLETLAADRPTPPDWVYVFNFENPLRPMALSLKPSRAPAFKAAMAKAVETLQATIPQIFESADYLAEVAEIDRDANDLIKALQAKTEAADLTITAADDGYQIVAVQDGRQMSNTELKALAPGERRRIETLVQGLQDELEAIIAQLPRWEREGEEKQAQLGQKYCKRAVDQALTPVAKGFAGNPKMNKFLDAVRSDILTNLDLFSETEADDPVGLARFTGTRRSQLFKYQVNVVVTRGDLIGAPVVCENHPIYSHLVGITRLKSDFSAPAHDFTSIQAGSLHKALGGFIVLDIEDVLHMPMAWEVLKRTIRSGEIAIDTPRQWIGEYGLEELDPEPIPFDTKVVLTGDRTMHHRLSILDPDFTSLFKVLADYAEDMPRGHESDQQFAGMIANIAKKDKMRPFDPEAMGRLVEESARYAEDAEKISLMIGPLTNLMAESEHWAAANGHPNVMAEDVDQAIEAQFRRSDQLRELSHENILREFINVETSGEKIGQINGLVITGLQRTFGRPTRISARVRMGNGRGASIEQVVDIQREVEMGGASHSKGVLILSGYLQSTYSPNQPMSLLATLVFEQSHSFVDGDSASCAELCALLSAIAQVPIKQNYAMTGSISQSGQVQAIGGVNEKIEGFYDICHARGLTGDQGVIIPHANVKNLMLRNDIVEAVKDGKFQVFAIETVGQGLEILTGLTVGEKRIKGRFPSGTISALVDERLEKFEDNRRRAARPWQANGRS